MGFHMRCTRTLEEQGDERRGSNVVHLRYYNQGYWEPCISLTPSTPRSSRPLSRGTEAANQLQTGLNFITLGRIAWSGHLEIFSSYFLFSSPTSTIVQCFPKIRKRKKHLRFGHLEFSFPISFFIPFLLYFYDCSMLSQYKKNFIASH